MELVSCRACTREISPRAEVCIHCGHPIEKERQENKDMYQAFIIMAILIVFVILYKLGVVDYFVQKIVDSFIPKLQNK